MQFKLIQELMLLEKISVTSLGTQVRQTILKDVGGKIMTFYKKNLKDFPFYVYKKDPDAVGVSNEEGYKLCNAFIETYLVNYLTIETRKAMDTHRAKCIFAEMKSADGEYDHDVTTIRINQNYIPVLGKAIYNSFSNHWFDTGFEEQSSFEVGDYDFSGPITRVVEIWTHEITHGLQFIRSRMGILTYRSYFEKDKNKFYNILRGASNTKEYLGSPEEIGAFASETVYGIMKDIDDEDLDYQIIAISDLIKYSSGAAGTRYRRFMDSKDPKEQKVLRRFIKKVYMELDDRRDELLAKKKAEMKKAKEEEFYDQWLKELDKELGLA
jgi:hypothetical protein